MKKTSHLVYSTKKVMPKRPSNPIMSHDEQPSQPPSPHCPASPVEIVRHTSAPSSTSSSSSSSSARSHRRHRSSSTSSRRSRAVGQTVRQLRPSRALLQNDHISVAQCVRTMVDKQTEATLLVDKNGLLTGILTDRDIAFKVIAAGKNPSLTRVSEVMTPNPSCVSPHASAIEALKKMVSGQFRHLPVADNEKVVGILDIAKCLYEAISKIEHTYDASSEHLSEAMRKLEQHMTQENLFETIRQQLFLPTLSAILSQESVVPVVCPSTTAIDAAKLMKENKISAVIVCNGSGDMIGIVTTKDLMRRVVAKQIDPSKCSVAEIMTKNPYSATIDTTILDTLHSMHNGKFLHVPVFSNDKKLIGLVDVLQVTCGVVQQIRTFQRARNESGQPLWNQKQQHRESIDTEEEEHTTSGEPVDEEHEVDEILQDVDALSLSGHDRSWEDEHPVDRTEADASNPAAPEDTPPPDVFVYKLADCYGSNHRFTSSAESVKELLRDVRTRLGDHTIESVHYVDDDGDHVLLFTDKDLKDAVHRARMWGNKYIRLIVPHLAAHRVEGGGVRAARRAFASGNETTIGIVYYAAAAAAIAGASFFLSRRR